MRREHVRGICGLVGAWLAIAAQTAQAQPRAPDCGLRDGEMRSVVRVVDGDTVVIDGGSEVRLIGALAPRA